ncbi:MAG: aminoacyltransferase [Hyphomicrobiales bacterium]|nr:aminoacyltransferase [Hyphomicrobiales bacterium]
MNSKTASYRMPIADPSEQKTSGQAPHSSSFLKSGIELEIISENEWDNIATRFGDIIPEQTGTFNVSRWGHDNIECVKILRHGEIIAGAVLIVRKIPFSTTGLAVLKWGPVWYSRDPDHNFSNYSLAVKAIMSEYCEKRNFHLTIMPMAVPQIADKTCEELLSLGFKLGNSLAAPERYFVNTDQNPECLMTSLNQKWRYNLRKAHKNDFDIQFADDEHGLEVFQGLYTDMIERKQFLDASAIGSLRNIMQSDVKNVRPKIVLVYHNGKVTAGGVFSVIGNMAVYMFGATDDRALTLKAGYAMHWWVAEHFCNREDINWYDLGGNDLDAGLHQFKKGFVGKTGVILQAPARYHFTSSIAASLAGYAVFKLRDSRGVAMKLIHNLKQKATK